MALGGCVRMSPLLVEPLVVSVEYIFDQTWKDIRNGKEEHVLSEYWLENITNNKIEQETH